MSSNARSQTTMKRSSVEEPKMVVVVPQRQKLIVNEKPVPVKRKKKVEKSFENLMGQCQMDGKRAKIEEAVVVSKPPIPPKPDRLKLQNQAQAQAKESHNKTLSKLKKKNEEANQVLVQKLNCYIEQMRLEIQGLKTSLLAEKNAVRALRAQHEAVNRRMTSDAKKNNQTSRKAPPKKPNTEVKTLSVGTECLLLQEQHSSKLNQEINVLKDTNKFLEEKIHITSEAEKRKSADIRELKDSYELRLTQISKSAKKEIHRLLEEIKTKDNHLKQLKKELLKKDSKNPATNMRKDAVIITTTTTTQTTQNVANQLAIVAPHEDRILEVHTDLLQLKKDSANVSDDDDSALSSSPSPSCSADSPTACWQPFPKESYVDGLRNELEFVQHENEILKSEIETAREQISSLERNLAKLEHKESELIKETHELREQNDLLEFRIVELEESHDKWSLRSNPTPDTRDMWTDTEKEPDDMMMMMSDRSDSGVTSPHSNHQIEDRISLPSPCDLSMIDNIPSDDIRKRIMAMTKRSCYDEEDKICLMQILSLLNNLEALSQDQEITGEFMSLESTPSKPNQEKSRIVATVQPYNNSDNSSSASSNNLCEDPIKPQLQHNQKTNGTSGSTNKAKFWTSLQESGVFEEQVIVNQCTQTYPEDFPIVEKPSGDLTAEIQKLNKFRERIEECVGGTKNPKVSVVKLLSPEQRKLEYYKERLEILESKIMIYESSDDIQMRKLADRLQREIRLESTVKQLTEKIAELEHDNQILDEERCEFEEAENDTRLKFQRLEVDFEILTQRNVELEMNEEGLQSKMKDAKKQIATLEERIVQLRSRIAFLESQDSIETTKPPTDLMAPRMCSESEQELRDKLNEMLTREREMQQNLDELKRAYNETLENADNVWAEMENDYKTKLKKCEVNEINLQGKLQQLEERIKNDSQFAQERLLQMEELESNLKNRISKLNRDNKELTTKYTNLLDEFNSLKEEYQKLKAYLSGPAVEILDRERRKVKTLEDDLKHTSEMLKQIEDKSKESTNLLKTKMTMAIKELENIKITNNELQEEVITLEARIIELKRMQVIDEDTIKSLTDELKMKQKQMAGLQNAIQRNTQPTLAQELSHTAVLSNLAKPKTTPEDPRINGLKGVKRMADSFLEQNGKPKILPKPEDIGRFVTKV